MSSIPTNEQILNGLTGLADAWRPLAIFWHAFFAILVVAVIFGVRPSKRISGVLLSLPFLCVSILAWSIMNPFNGIIFAVVGLLLIAVSIKLPLERVRVAPCRVVMAGAFMFVFGWVYPHFLDSSSSMSFLYSSPTGIIPCETLSIGIGLALLLNGLGSRKLSVILSVSGIIFGVTGVMQLGVAIDIFLLFGALTMLFFSFKGLRVVSTRSSQKSASTSVRRAMISSGDRS